MQDFASDSLFNKQIKNALCHLATRWGQQKEKSVETTILNLFPGTENEHNKSHHSLWLGDLNASRKPIRWITFLGYDLYAADGFSPRNFLPLIVCK